MGGWWRAALPVVGAVSIGGAAVGCTEFEPGSDRLDEAVLTEQVEPGKDWSCLSGDGLEPEAVVPSAVSGRLVMSMQVLSVLSGQAVAGASARACSQRDVSCSMPLTQSVPLDADGWLDLPLYEGFDGYIEVVADSIVPAIVFFTSPLTADSRVDAVPFGLIERAALANLSGAVGIQTDPAMGLVWLRAFDCQGVAAAGVSFNIDREGTAYYFVGALPSSTAQQTAETGLGGFINVPPGVAVVGAELPGTGQVVTGPKSLLVRSGWMSGVRFAPRGSPR